MPSKQRPLPMRIVKPVTTATGEAGYLIECTCRTHPTGKTRAIVHASHKANMDAKPREFIHGYVLAAWHPLAGPDGMRRGLRWRA